MFKMTSNILRNLSVKKATRRYPYEVRAPFERVRGELVNEIQNCIFCGSCELKCPSRCIAVDKEAGWWIYDPFACIYCGVCVDACPVQCLTQKLQYRPPVAERLIIRLQGQPRKKAKGKEKAAEKEVPKDSGEEKEPSGSPPPA